LWVETVHDERGRYEGARLLRRPDGLLALAIGHEVSTLDPGDARSLFHALGEALQEGAPS